MIVSDSQRKAIFANIGKGGSAKAQRRMLLNYIPKVIWKNRLMEPEELMAHISDVTKINPESLPSFMEQHSVVRGGLRVPLSSLIPTDEEREHFKEVGVRGPRMPSAEKIKETEEDKKDREDIMGLLKTIGGSKEEEEDEAEDRDSEYALGKYDPETGRVRELAAPPDTPLVELAKLPPGSLPYRSRLLDISNDKVRRDARDPDSDISDPFEGMKVV